MGRSQPSCRGERLIRLWDTTTGASLAELKRHTFHVFTASFSPDGTRVLTVSHDKAPRLWGSFPYRERFKERQAKAPVR